MSDKLTGLVGQVRPHADQFLNLMHQALPKYLKFFGLDLVARTDFGGVVDLGDQQNIRAPKALKVETTPGLTQQAQAVVG